MATSIQSPGITRNDPVMLADGVQKDAFSRLRVSNPILLLSSTLDYDLRADIWEKVETGSGTVTHLPDESSARLRVTANGDVAAFQSRQYYAYRAGQSQLVFTTFKFADAAGDANIRQRVGYFDASDGIFLERVGDGVSVVRRTSTSGAPVPEAVAQADWNIDRFDGTGPSRLVADWDVTQILAISVQWLGVGRVLVALDIDGQLYGMHQFLWANHPGSEQAYMKTARLPVRYEIEVTGITTVANRDMTIICASVIREGEDPEAGPVAD